MAGSDDHIVEFLTVLLIFYMVLYDHGKGSARIIISYVPDR